MCSLSRFFGTLFSQQSVIESKTLGTSCLPAALLAPFKVCTEGQCQCALFPLSFVLFLVHNQLSAGKRLDRVVYPLLFSFLSKCTPKDSVSVLSFPFLWYFCLSSLDFEGKPSPTSAKKSDFLSQNKIISTLRRKQNHHLNVVPKQNRHNDPLPTR